MLLRSTKKQAPKSIPRDLVALAFLNGLSGMALSGAAVFGMLAVLSGGYFLHGLTGLGFYVLGGAVACFIGYAGVCLYGARMGLKHHAALYAVFAVHAVGFLAAATIHPAFVALSAGLGLGMFYSIFMLRNINDISDKARDGYATLAGVTQQAVALAAPVLGAIALYWGTKAGFHDPFFPAFLVFGCSVLVSIPLIHRIPNKPLPHSAHLPFKAVFKRHHISAIALFVSTQVCDAMMNPLFIIVSFAMLGKPVNVGWFAALVAVLAAVSLFISRRTRLTGKRWVIMSAGLLAIGLAFGAAVLSFQFAALLVAGAIYAIARANYGAAWFAIATRVMEHEWKDFGKNQALVLGEIFVLTGRFMVAGILLACGYSDITLRESLGIIIGCYLTAAIISSLLARFMDRRHKAQMGVV